MARYFATPRKAERADWSDDYPLLPDLHVPEHRPIATGVLDIRGDAIMRMPNPIGFGRDQDW